MGTLQGWTRPIVGGAGLFADHTSVNCTGVPGKDWPCWGVPPKGAVCCAGPGSTAQADCYSNPASKAGIVYLFTGVCHQASNRILFPAGVVVNLAVGFRVSVFLYGVYGLNLVVVRARIFRKVRKKLGFLPALAAVKSFNKQVAKHGGMNWGAKRRACAGIVNDLPQCMPPPGGAGSGTGGGAQTPPENDPPGSDASALPNTPEDDAFVEAILALYADADVEISDDQFLEEEELVLTTKAHIQMGAEDDRFDTMITARDEFHEYHSEVLGEFLLGELPTEAVVERLNEAGQAFQISAAEILGPDDFKSLFRLTPGEPINLVDPTIMQETYGEQITP